MVRIRLWDLPTRVFHWTLLALVATSFATALTGGNAMEWHGRAGVTIIGLLAFRIVWGFVGSTHARFGSFVRGPATIGAYLRGRWVGVGHNPLGALSVLGMLLLLLCQAIGGLFANDDIAFNGPYFNAISKDLSDWITSWHKLGAWVILGLIGLHLGAILFYTHVRKETLIKPMLTGTREVPESLAGASARGGGLAALIAALALGFAACWAASGALLPAPTGPTHNPGATPMAKPPATTAW
ncbi:MAG: cytochrome B [Rhodocyclaceae bacterium]|nr:MAG: cytochrome B [Rhodocyclaceae bacterium]